LIFKRFMISLFVYCILYRTSSFISLGTPRRTSVFSNYTRRSLRFVVVFFIILYQLTHGVCFQVGRYSPSIEKPMVSCKYKKYRFLWRWRWTSKTLLIETLMTQVFVDRLGKNIRERKGFTSVLLGGIQNIYPRIV
jgi:hypothetical protein